MSRYKLKYALPCLLFITILLISFLPGLHHDDIHLIIPGGWPAPVYDFSRNQLSPKKFELGRKLFYDPRLSKNGTVSCGSCHKQEFAFADGGKTLSIGVSQTKGRRNTPALFNLAWGTSFMWDGGVNNLEVQPLNPIMDHAEMDNTLADVVNKLNTDKVYTADFYLAFGDSIITGQHVLKALAQFMVMLESYNSKYDRYMRHEPGITFTEPEQNGLQLFRKNCASCHAEPLFTNNTYQNNGLPTDPTLTDTGRIRITHNSNDLQKFKVPSLRNVAKTYPYMHDGRYPTLMAVLDHYTHDMDNSPTLAKELMPHPVLTAHEQADIIAFLETLTDETLLHDERLAPPKE